MDPYLLITCEPNLPFAARSRSTAGEGRNQVDLVTIRESLGFIDLPAIDDEQDGLVPARNRYPIQQVREGAPHRQRHVETAQRPARRLALQGGVEVYSHYQLKMLSRSASDAS